MKNAVFNVNHHIYLFIAISGKTTSTYKNANQDNTKQKIYQNNVNLLKTASDTQFFR